MAWTPTLQELERAKAGQYGLIWEVGTTAITGSFCKLKCITETTFAKLTDNITGDTITAVAFPAGTVLEGLFTAFTLTSGSVLAYKTGVGI